MDDDEIRATLDRIERRQVEQGATVRAVADGLMVIADRLERLTTALENHLEVIRDLLTADLGDDELDDDA